MGDARRRRLQQQAQPTQSPTVQYTDAASGQPRTARNAGDPVRFLRQFRSRTDRSVASVPCAGCTACCFCAQIDFDSAMERPADLAHLDFAQIDGGRVRLSKRPDGSCVHLIDGNCSVYEHRPQPCRSYDCRSAALVSMTDNFGDGRFSPAWIFEATTEEARILRTGFQVLSAEYKAHARKAGKGITIKAALDYVLARIEPWCDEMKILVKLPTEKLVELFGFDPRSISESDVIQSMRGNSEP